MVRRLVVVIMCHFPMVLYDAQHRKLCYSFQSISQIRWRQKKAMVLEIPWSSMSNCPCKKPTRSRTGYWEQQRKVKLAIPPHATNWTNSSWLNLHWHKEAVHTNGRKEKNIVWTEIVTKGMRIPTSTETDAAIRNIAAIGWRFYQYDWFSHQKIEANKEGLQKERKEVAQT